MSCCKIPRPQDSTLNDNLGVLVCNIMGEIFGCDPSTVGPGSSMESIKAWDSLQHLHLVLGLEGRLAIQFTGDEIVKMTSFDQIMVAARKALSNKPRTIPGDKAI